MKTSGAILRGAKDVIFRSIHGNNLVYNTCWEDPRLDRKAFDFKSDDRVVVISSAGCNVLDYVLAGVEHVHAVDVNPRQNALLELKRAAILELPYEELFAMFGRGMLANCQDVYNRKLRSHLSVSAQEFWDTRISFFTPSVWHKSFYFRGSAGLFARGINFYIDRIPGLRNNLVKLFAADTLQEQASIYFDHVKPRFWGKLVEWIVGRDLTLAMLGVPYSQRREIDTQYQGGVVKFIEDCVDTVFGKLSLKDNYFWRLYVFGEYTEECCPEYLKRNNFDLLRSLVVDKVSCHTSTLTDFFSSRKHDVTCISLLDHMDWLSATRLPDLQAEWQMILMAAKKGARIIWRSGGVKVGFVDPIVVNYDGQTTRVGDILVYDYDLANELHAKDRVHTYGSFYIATVGQT